VDHSQDIFVANPYVSLMDRDGYGASIAVEIVSFLNRYI